MSPQTNPAPATSTPKPMQDIKPPTAAKSNSQTNNTDLIQTEIEHSIPVKQPGQPASDAAAGGPNNPIAGASQFVQEDSRKDSDLEKVLKDVNQKVKDADKKVKKHSFLHFKKTKTTQPATQPAKSDTKKPHPVLIAATAFIVAAALAVAAFYAFKQPVGTSSNQVPLASDSGKSGPDDDKGPVRPEDLGNLYSDIQSKLNSLNDQQDFNSADLSDQNLGL